MTRRRDQRGVAIIEAAFVLPILLTFILGALDLGDWALQNAQASAAARDGARVGIIHYGNADTTGTSDYTTVSQAVAARLAGQQFTLTINCVVPTGTTVLNNGCAPAVQGCDRIMVTVTWTRTPWTPIGSWFGQAHVSGKSAMVISGAPLSNGATPTTVYAPNGCAA